MGRVTPFILFSIQMSDDTYFLQSEVIAPNKVFLVPTTYRYLSYIYTYVVAIWFKRIYDVGVYCVIKILILSWKKKF